jgi:hypothetical protein
MYETWSAGKAVLLAPPGSVSWSKEGSAWWFSIVQAGENREREKERDAPSFQ